jgi:hypothetical protein
MTRKSLARRLAARRLARADWLGLAIRLVLIIPVDWWPWNR